MKKSRTSSIAIGVVKFNSKSAGNAVKTPVTNEEMRIWKEENEELDGEKQLLKDE